MEVLKYAEKNVLNNAKNNVMIFHSEGGGNSNYPGWGI